MKGRNLVTAIAVASGLSLASAGMAADMEKQQKKDYQSPSMSQQQGQQQQGQQPTQYAQQLSSPEQLSKAKIQTQQGQELGSVEQVLVDPQKGEISYILMKSKSGQGMEIVPWNALEVQQQQGQVNLVLQQQQQQFTSPDQFKQAKIQNKQGQEVGTVERTFLDTQEGKLAYMLVKTKQGTQAIVPFNALKVQEQQQQGQQQALGQQQQQQQPGQMTLVFQGEAPELKEAPQGDLPNILDRKQGEMIHQYYGVSPYWGEGGGQQQQQQPEQKKQQDQQQPFDQGTQQQEQQDKNLRSIMD